MEGGGLNPWRSPMGAQDSWSEGGGSWVSGSEGGGAGALTVSVPEWIIKLNPLSAQVIEIHTTDDLTEAWLKEKLSFFR